MFQYWSVSIFSFQYWIPNYEIIYNQLERVLWPWTYSYSTSCRSIEFPASDGIFCPLRGKYFQLVLDLFFFFFCYVHPLALGDFAKKRVLKLVKWFSGHCRAIKSLNVSQSHLQAVHFAAFWSRCKISACEVQAGTESKISRQFCGLKVTQQSWLLLFAFYPPLFFGLSCLTFFCFAGDLVGFILVGKGFRKGTM